MIQSKREEAARISLKRRVSPSPSQDSLFMDGDPIFIYSGDVSKCIPNFMLTETARRRNTQRQREVTGQEPDPQPQNSPVEEPTTNTRDDDSISSMENYNFEDGEVATEEQELEEEGIDDVVDECESVEEAIAKITNEDIDLRGPGEETESETGDNSADTQGVDESSNNTSSILSPPTSVINSKTTTATDQIQPDLDKETLNSENTATETVVKKPEIESAPDKHHGEVLDKTDRQPPSISKIDNKNSQQSEKINPVTTAPIILNDTRESAEMLQKPLAKNSVSLPDSKDIKAIGVSPRSSGSLQPTDSPPSGSPASHQSLEKKKTSIPVYKTKVCELCEDFTRNKPVKIKTPYVLKAFASSSALDSYVCLSGVHLTKKGQTWSLCDGCKVHKGDMDTEWLVGNKVKNHTKISLSNFDCLYVPIVRGKGYWLVRQVSDFDDGGAVDGAPIAGGDDIPTGADGSKKPPEVKEVFADEVVHVNPQDSLSTDEEEEEIVITRKNETNWSVTDGSNRKGSETSQIISNATGKIKDNLFGAIKKGGAIIGELMDDNVSGGGPQQQQQQQQRASVPNKHTEILRDEFVTVSQKYVKPLKKIIYQICDHLDKVPFSEQGRRGDDFSNLDLGWLIRDNFCTILAQLLLVGLRGQKNVLMSLFGKQKTNTLWDIVREFALEFQLAEFDNVVKTVGQCQDLPTDDSRFRAFVCELLNRSTVGGTSKLIVVFFQQFPLVRSKLERFYVEDSFWRLTYDPGFSTIHEAIIIAVKNFNGCPFNFHLDFERRHRHVITSPNNAGTVEQQHPRTSRASEDSLFMME